MFTSRILSLARSRIISRTFSTCRPTLNVQKSALSKLRQKTGLPSNLCREALTKHDNNVAEAEAWLQARRKIDHDFDDEEDDDDEEAVENPLLMDDALENPADGRQRTVIEVGSLRLDAVSKMAFGVTRAKLEEMFYKGELLVNGRVPSKKSQDICLGDEIDLIKQVNAEDRTKVDIRRVLIASMPDKATEHGRMKLTIDRWTELTVDMPDRNKD